MSPQERMMFCDKEIRESANKEYPDSGSAIKDSFISQMKWALKQLEKYPEIVKAAGYFTKEEFEYEQQRANNAQFGRTA